MQGPRHDKPPVRYCSESGGKVVFDKKGAITAANLRFKQDHIKLRAYSCPYCRGWHLTKRLHWNERELD